MGPAVGNTRVGGSRQASPLQQSSPGVVCSSVCLSAHLGAQQEKAMSGVIRGKLEKQTAEKGHWKHSKVEVHLTKNLGHS